MKRRLTEKEHQKLIDALLRDCKKVETVACAAMDFLPEEQTNVLFKSAEAQQALAAVLAEATIRVPRRKFDPGLDFLTHRDATPEDGVRLAHYTVIRIAADGQHSRTSGYRPAADRTTPTTAKELIALIAESRRDYYGCIIVCTEKLVTEVFHVDSGGAISRVAL